MAPYQILLLTNRDSDNCGDLLIEATVISLIKAAMKNIGLSESDYKINSRAAGIISRKYMKTRDEALLEDARNTISQSDVVIFGGAPLFNYAYQNFYLRTIRTIELAQEYNVPVLFSSIGVEEYSDTNPKSQALKEALHLPVVKQITTRDDIDSVRAYLDGTDKKSALVSDPAVFTNVVFDSAVQPKTQPSAVPTIGLVVTRAGIFKDNRIDFSEDDQREFWLSTIRELTDRGYDYKLFTTGHFSDEVFLDSLLREENIPPSKVEVNITSPEEMLSAITTCSGIIAYRLHANIAAFSYRVPAIGLTWNFKVPYFYETVGYPERALSVDLWKSTVVVDALERAMQEGVEHDETFTTSVYRTLFDGLKGIFAPDSEIEPYSLDQLTKNLPRHRATNQAQYRVKANRKLRRTYENYQKLARKVSGMSQPENSGAEVVPTKSSSQPVDQQLIDAQSRIQELESILAWREKHSVHASLQLGRSEHAVTEMESALADVQAQIEQAQRRVKALEESTSWRVTKPLRVARKLVRRVRPRRK